MTHARQVPDQLYRIAFDQTAIGMGLVGMHGRWLAVNPALCRILGYTEPELATLTWRDITHPDDVTRDAVHIKALLAGKSDSYTLRKRCIRRDGSSVEMQVGATMRRGEDADSTFFIIQLLDLPQAAAEEEAKRQREKLRLLVENVSDAFIGMDEDGMITEWNQQAERLLQWTAVEAIGRSMTPTLVPERFRSRHEAGLRRFVDTGVPHIINKPVEVPLLRRDGTEIQAEMTIGAARHHDRYYFATFVRDISERKEFERRLHEQATLDHLTGLPNRFEFMRRLEGRLADAQAGRATLALMFIDLDGFKGVNDLCGHHEGDRVLQEFAAALGHSVRHSDIVGRLAGDEFVVLVTGFDDAAADLAVVARKVLAAARSCSRPGAPVGASVGIAVHEQGVDAHGLMKRADIAMYAAKQAGKDGFMFDERIRGTFV